MPPKPTEDNTTQEITGLVTESGRSRGKTLAAWDGVPSGQEFLLVQLDGDVPRPPTASSSVHVWFPDLSPPSLEGLVGQRLHLRGDWEEPPVEEFHSFDQPRQQPLAPIKPLLLPDLEALSSWDPADADSQREPPIPEPPAAPPSTDVGSWGPVARRAHFRATFLAPQGEDAASGELLHRQQLIEVTGVIEATDFIKRSKKRGKPNDLLVLTLRVDAVDPPSHAADLPNVLTCQRRALPGDRALSPGDGVRTRLWIGPLASVSYGPTIYELERLE